MADTQLWLLDPPQPLRERLGTDFFRSLPSRPGVYVMSGGLPGGQCDAVLYVGKSVNLRRRLGSYNGVRPGRCSKRIVRLVHSVERIEWEECRDERAALIRENQLIRELRPRFNRANTWPQGYWYVGFKGGVQGCFRLCLQHEPAPEWGWYGAFRGSRGYGALCRWLWRLEQGPGKVPPSRWLQHQPLRCLDFRLEGSVPGKAGVEWVDAVRWFLEGRCDGLLAPMRERVGRVDGSAGFRGQLEAADLELLEGFWRQGLRRSWEIRQQAGVRESFIEREQLDDLLVLHGGVGCRVRERDVDAGG